MTQPSLRRKRVRSATISFWNATASIGPICRRRELVAWRKHPILLNLADMDPLLKLLHENAALKPAQLAAMLNTTEEDVVTKIKAYEVSEVILGYRTVLNEEKLNREIVRAVIEVKITPERGGGFDRLAERIAKYGEVESCYLMSGGYDLMVVVKGTNLREVASFVSEKLATVQGVISTATHFMLKPYKQQGVLMKREINEERLAVTP